MEKPRSCDAHYLVMTSTDGYVTVVQFTADELGIPLSEEMQLMYTRKVSEEVTTTMTITTTPSAGNNVSMTSLRKERLKHNMVSATKEKQEPLNIPMDSTTLAETSISETMIMSVEKIQKKRRIQPIFVKPL
jgi:hypothetical protein